MEELCMFDSIKELFNLMMQYISIEALLRAFAGDNLEQIRKWFGITVYNQWRWPRVLCNYSFARCHHSWWYHEMENFSALLSLFCGNSPVTDAFPAHGPVTRSFDVFFDLRLNKRLSKQSWRWWFEPLLRPLWRHLCLYQPLMFPSD